MKEAERLAERLETEATAWERHGNQSEWRETLRSAAALIRSQAEEMERLRGALRDVGVAWDSAPTVAGLLDGRAAKWFFDTLAPAMIAARKALNEQAARAALGEAKAAPEQEQGAG